MKSYVAVTVASMLLWGVGCGAKKEVPSQPAAGTALSRDGALSYVLNQDADTLTVMQRKNKRKVAEVPVGKAPEHIAVGPDDTLYVANRGSRSISVIRAGAWREAERITAGLEPLAVAVSPDNRTLYVINGSSHEKADAGTLMAIDLETRATRWELPVVGEPRALALVNQNTARIELYRQDEPLIVNLSGPHVVQRAKPARAVKPAMHASVD